MIRQTVQATGPVYETRLVMLACLLILVCAALLVLFMPGQPTQRTLQANEVDARHDLNAAEQGIYADLLVAVDEIEEMEYLPEVADLNELLIAPFVQDMTSARRGGHLWTRLQGAKHGAYLGLSQQPDVAANFLLSLPEPRRSSVMSNALMPASEVEVWILRSPELVQQVPGVLSGAWDRETLKQLGWQQVVSFFDASVTRSHPHP